MTRGRESNTAHVVTGNTAPPGHQPYQQATPESVLAGVMRRDDGDLSATEQIRQAQDWAGGTGHLLTLWSAAVRQTLHPDIDQQIKARLTESEAWRYDREHSRQALQQRLRAAQLAGHDISALIDQITAAPMDRRPVHLQRPARPPAAARPARPAGTTLTWAQRTPASAPAVAHELAAALDDRARALGEQLAASPEPWLARHLGVLAPGASPALREEYTRRAGTAAAYREAAGITNPDQAVSPEPHRGNPELEAMRKAVIRRPGDPRRSRHHPRPGPRRARSTSPRGRTRPGHRPARRQPASCGSPPKPKPTPCRQSADAHAQHDHTGAASATGPRRAAGRRTPAPRSRQRPIRAMVRRHPRHQGSSRESHGRTATTRARPARQRTSRRSPKTNRSRWPDGGAVRGGPRRRGTRHRPPAPGRHRRRPALAATAHSTGPSHARRRSCGHHAAATRRVSSGMRPGSGSPRPWICSANTEAPAAQHEADDRAARLDDLQARADEAVHRIGADHAEREARAEYMARLEREAHTQAEPAAGREAEASDGIEIEL